jgi:uncharacterized repeat protein (TIGR01451 family)
VKGGLAIKSMIVIGALIIMLFGMASGSTIHSIFTAVNNDSTMMFYSYLKEPRLEESGYKQGYKTGSLNYLVEGDIDFTDNLIYYDGTIDAAHRNETGVDRNATLRHDQTVKFEGKKGISEFYATGFFPSNRAVSAWKKIRYDELDNYLLGPSGMSSKISVVAIAGMGPAKRSGMRSDYDFTYHAKVEDGVMEIRDATGWTNQTGARRTDWEQTAFMKGRALDVRNDLQVENLFYPGAGLGIDWIPCVVSTYAPRTEGWPSLAAYAVLTPQQKLPYLSRTDNCDASSGCKETSKGSIGIGIIGSEMALVPNSISPFEVSAKNRVLTNNSSTSSGSDKASNITKTRSPIVTYATRTADSPINIGAIRTRSVSMQAAASGCGVPGECGVSYNSLPCKYCDCPGFEGIYSCAEEAGEAPGAGISGLSITSTQETKQGPDIGVKKEITANDEQYITYKITVTNDGGTGLENVNLTDSLPNGLEYSDAILSFGNKKGVSLEEGRTKPDDVTRTNTYTNLTWMLGGLSPNENAVLNLTVKKSISTILPTANKAYAWGNWTNSTTKTAEPVSAEAVAVEMLGAGPSPI